MIKIIKEYFDDWSKFERAFLIIGIFATILTSIIFNGNMIDILYSSLYFVTALLMSKGKVESYFVGFVSVVFYGIVSYKQAYYGELIITIFLTLPIMVIGIINWMKNKDEESNIVIINEISKKEVLIVLIIQGIMLKAYYMLLKSFNTDLLVISSISIATSVLASYFEARRSELALVFYVINDLILIILWGFPIINGDVALFSILIGPILLLINDTYGTFNWKRLKQKQLESI